MKWILCIGPTHIACHLQFQNDFLLKFQFVTYVCMWSMLWKNSLMRWKLSSFLHGSQTWPKVCGITYNINATNFIKVWNQFNFKTNIFAFLIHNYKYFLVQIYFNPPWYIKNHYFIFYSIVWVMFYPNM